ncbi:MAG: DUF6077 domain-containing protein [Ruminococcus sp.]|jgi:hypothetical protein
MGLSQIAMLLIWYGLVPVMLGMLYTKFSGRDRDSLMLNYCSGLITMLAVCQLVTVPGVLNRGSFTFVSNLYVGIILGLCFLSLVLNITFYVRMFRAAFGRLKGCPWTVWAAVALIVVQTLVITVGRHIDEDDAFYVGVAVAAQETDEMYTVDPYTGEEYDELPARYILSPFPVFMASSGEITGVHPAILAHTVFPVFLIPFTYMIYALLGKRLFGKERRLAGFFLILVCLLHIFSGYSVYTQGTFLLVRIWQGKAILAAALIPAVYYYGLRTVQEKKGKAANFIMLLLLMLACCHVSSMGIMLGAIAMGLVGIGCALRYKKPEILICGALSCIPNVIYSVIYLTIR